MVVSVLLPVQPKKIGMPGVFIFAVSTMIFFFSSGDSMEVSPVDPMISTADVRFSSWNLSSVRKAAKSTVPSLLNGVMRATNEPVSFLDIDVSNSKSPIQSLQFKVACSKSPVRASALSISRDAQASKNQAARRATGTIAGSSIGWRGGARVGLAIQRARWPNRRNFLVPHKFPLQEMSSLSERVRK